MNSFKKTIKKVFQSELGPLLALFVIIGLFGIADKQWGAGTFLTPRNFRVFLNSAALIAVPALGMTLIIIAGGIDLSAGTAITLAGTVLATILKNSEHAAADSEFFMVISIAVTATVAMGCLAGLINGALIASTRVVPFIVTLGTMTIFLGAGQIIANESTVYAPKENIPQWLSYLCYTGPKAEYYLLGLHIPSSILITGVLAILVWLMLKFTVFGRNVFAIGSSESTARLCGVKIPLTIVAVYVIAGIFVGVGGLLYFGDVKNGNPSDGMGKELEIIAAVVLGGGSLSGGRGSILGTLIGAVIITSIRSGCSALSIPNTYTHIIIGCIIIIAVIVDQLRHGSPEWLFRMTNRMMKSEDGS